MENRTEPNAPLPWLPQYGWTTASMRDNARGRAAGSGAGRSPAKAQSIPMEGAVLYQKAIDNSSVSYRHDPRDRYVLRTHVSWGLFVVLILILASGPRLWVRHSGYRQAQLTETIEQLTAVREHLKVEKGRLEELQRVAALAQELGLGETEDDSYTWTAARPLDGASEPTVARLISSQE